MKFVFLCFLVVISGCVYPRCQLQRLNDSTFEYKRCDKKTLNIQEFIRPEETSDFLEQMNPSITPRLKRWGINKGHTEPPPLIRAINGTVLRRECIQNKYFSPDSEKNTVLNILYFAQKIKNTKESKEFWQYPGETIQKGGDCEDKTFLLLSALIKAGINDVMGVKGRYLGQGHMWVEYKGYILDPSLKTTKLISAKKSIGYVPFFKFDKNNIYFCDTKKGE